ncbi:Os08g0284800 [Oryza sativa Japonica Group]|uniref:Os08g0284800 protein n=1 Tax=Oryza sativa subsp. japonica TaxID=39947 RepID=A0A0P0XDX3_ORYSJ|nr:Os08g0284800 [Oryza sativa Japonica Group]
MPCSGGRTAAAALPSSLRRHELFPHRCRTKTTMSLTGVKELAEQGDDDLERRRATAVARIWSGAATASSSSCFISTSKRRRGLGG